MRHCNTRSRRIGILLANLAILLAGCGAGSSQQEISAVVPSLPPLPAAEGLRVAVASDLHLNPDNPPDPGTPSAVSYSMELVDALLWDARQQNADLVLLTGDLCNGGKRHRHEALAQKLKQAEDTGTPVYVLPGNHDLSPVTQTEFAEIFADYGYAEAYSRDPASLSYAFLRDRLMVLMMDTAGYSASAGDLTEAPLPDSGNPYLSDRTLRWVEEMLANARENGRHVIAAEHYPILPEISRNPEYVGYYLENGVKFAALLRTYGVPLYLSGHMHTRAVCREGGLTELTTEYLLSYPTGYSILDITEDDIRYTPRRVDVDAWAVESGSKDPVLLDFARWQQEELLRYAHENVEYMAERNPLGKKESLQAAEFFYSVMDAYWQGTLHRDRASLEAMPGRASFFRCAEGYAYAWWLEDLMQNASDLLAGFTVQW